MTINALRGRNTTLIVMDHLMAEKMHNAATALQATILST